MELQIIKETTNVSKSADSVFARVKHIGKIYEGTVIDEPDDILDDFRK